MIDRRVVDHVARLARLELTPEERERFTRQLGALLEYFAVLQRLDTEGVAPTAHIVAMTNVLRDDTPRPGLPRDAVLGGAPEQEDGFFKVPPVIESETPP
ncbi:MAG: Asp-tRNA(Asn)/Glu-tRNA(Gln) amidotransferase subunit GatC [Armatimonadota bacterium]|nr:Asp-tRNA(Asn)/Glu-tRNA(Gln) amidotransferase subunit GatC [Armatimonadota bacterium]MDR7452075.1 Asp-tRNA(Asn)/Glu-tRNA(Gln) amidotransferase subunit GatC [Armatimonadota bacterium]MDR7466537.1 Asp-tRNA(Asn)/Glu-tRNA(Gln) amidotransferase subunit GatC [Armatimonadota bacterium]MDR7493259.1 Asp-tRNA(Asn)/Glu-tRNA(Gln) amidotransferase subunit GatC [Armatimonadota bacterium]MDR7499848.1 Asp-tRNA(Asn)/Glu-tRNA(Gln) amidotransferase subunit GatC [Armatimonadota bacterium]